MTQARLFPVIDIEDRYDETSDIIEEFETSDNMDSVSNDDSKMLEEELIKIFQELSLREIS